MSIKPQLSMPSHQQCPSDNLLPSPSDSLLVNNIIDARDQFSEYLLNELDDEIHKHVPDYKVYLDVLKAIGCLKFDLEVFEEALEERRESLAQEQTSMQILKALFDFSIVGYLKTGGLGGGSTYVFKYQDRRSRFDEAATTFRVHQGFKEVLSLKEGSA